MSEAVVQQSKAESPVLAQAVRSCVEARRPMIDYGIDHQGLGNPPVAGGMQLPTADAAVEHYERDFVVRAGAGIKMGELQASLRAKGQFLPIDADDDLTLGECITHNIYGPLRVGFGSFRDLLLGLHYFDGLGRDIHVGGRTVKNVAGYDVTRLMVGSLGELGIIHQATLRTYALPPHAMVVELEIDDPAAIDQQVTPWLLTDAAPSWLALEYETDRWTARLGYLGAQEACAAQLAMLKQMVNASSDMRITNSLERMFDDDGRDRANHRQWRRSSQGLIKIVVPAAQTGAICRELVQAMDNKIPIRIDAFPAHGGIFAGGDWDANMARAVADAMPQLVHEKGGFHIWHHRPADAMAQLAPFAPEPSDSILQRRLKRALDPLGLLNPGRTIS